MDNFTIAVNVGSRKIKVTSDGTEEGTFFEGKADDIKLAAAAAKRQDHVSFGKFGDAPIAHAGFESPIELAAALYAVSPETAELSEAPEEVYELLESYYERKSKVVIEDIEEPRSSLTKGSEQEANTESVTNVVKPYEKPQYDAEIRAAAKKRRAAKREHYIYGEATLSTVVSATCFLYLLTFGTFSLLSSTLLALIALIGTPLALHCAIMSIIKLYKDAEIFNFNYSFVVLFLISLPLLFLFFPEIGIASQFVDDFTDNFLKPTYEPQGSWHG